MELLLYIIIAIAIYYVLNWIHQFQWSSAFSEQTHRRIQKIIGVVILLYEPIVTALLLLSLIGIHPKILLPLVLVCLLLSYQYLRSYFARIFLLLTKPLHKASYVQVAKYSGKVADVGRFALRLESGSGSHLVPYHLLMSEGYTQSDQNQSGRLLEVDISPTGQHGHVQLQDVLASIPYLDYKMTPDIASEDNGQNIHLKLLLRDSAYRDEVISALERNGYQVRD